MVIKIPVFALVLIAVLMVAAVLQYVAISKLSRENRSLKRRLAYAEASLEPVTPERRWDNDNTRPYEPLNPWFWENVVEERQE